MYVSSLRGQKKASDLLQLELHLWATMWMLGTEPQSFVGTVSTFTCWAISLATHFLVLKKKLHWIFTICFLCNDFSFGTHEIGLKSTAPFPFMEGWDHFLDGTDGCLGNGLLPSLSRTVGTCVIWAGPIRRTVLAPVIPTLIVPGTFGACEVPVTLWLVPEFPSPVM